MARPLPELVLFLDQCLDSNQVVAAPRSASIHFERFRDHFARGTADVEWLPTIGARGWVLVSKDKWIRRRSLERRALEEARVTAFILTSKGMSGAEMASTLRDAFAGMRRIMRKHEPPLIASVSPGGKMRLIE